VKVLSEYFGTTEKPASSMLVGLKQALGRNDAIFGKHLVADGHIRASSTATCFTAFREVRQLADS
jgi:hypothetical protein